MIPCWTTCFTPTAGHRPFHRSWCHNRGIRWDKPGLGISLSRTSLWRTTRKLDKIHKHSHFGTLSASTPASIPLNLRGTVITVNVGATEESVREDKGDKRDSGCCSWSQKLFIKPTPPPTHTHTHNTATYIRTCQHTRLSPATQCCLSHFAELKDNIQIVFTIIQISVASCPVSYWFPCNNPS